MCSLILTALCKFCDINPIFSDEKLGSKEMEIRTLVGEALSLPAYSSLTHMG